MPALLLVVLTVLFRLPALMNAAGTTSDAAIVGIQARHMLAGEWSPLLLGSAYQTSADAMVAGAFFVVLGPTALALMLSTVTGHTVLTLLAYATFRRHVGRWTAFVLALPLVFTTGPLATFVLLPPRQASLTLVIASIWALDGAERGRRPDVRLAIGAALASLAVFADPYALLFAPVLALFGVAVVWGGKGTRRPHLLALSAGASLGALPFLALVRNPGWAHGEMGFSAAVVPRNVALLVREALPWTLGMTSFRASRVMDFAQVDAPPLLRAIGVLGGLSFAACVIGAAAMVVRRRGVPSVRRLGGAGLLLAGLTVASFCASVMVMDLFSARYLAALTLAAPYAMLPLAAAVRRRTFAALLAPYVIATAVSGWLGYGPWVRGPLPRVSDVGSGRDEADLAEALATRGVEAVIADYWASYRLSFLFGETPPVVPLNAREDRYPPHRARFERAQVFAYVHDAARSREDFATREREVVAGGVILERITIGTLRAVVVRRAPDPR